MVLDFNLIAFGQERDGLFHAEFSFPNMEDEQLFLIMLMTEVWAQKELSYLPYLLEDFLFFKSQADRNSFEQWLQGMNLDDLRDKVIPELNVDALLNKEDSLHLSGKIPYEIDIYTQDGDFIKEHYDICVWLVQHTSSEKGNRFWYDLDRQCFFFENASMATNFKLRFCPDGAKPKEKPKRAPHPQSSEDRQTQDRDYIEAFKERLIREQLIKGKKAEYDDYRNSKAWYPPDDPYGRS